MTASWQQPTTSRLSERLIEASERIRAIIPQLINLQASALAGMADVVRLAQPSQGGQTEVDNER